jgi:hypothetical protein
MSVQKLRLWAGLIARHLLPAPNALVTAILMRTAKATFSAIREMVDRQCLLAVVAKIVIPVRIFIAHLSVRDLTNC